MTTPLEGPQGTTRLGHLLGPHGVQGGGGGSTRLYKNGVLMAIEAAVRHYYQRPDLAGLRFAELISAALTTPANGLPPR